MNQKKLLFGLMCATSAFNLFAPVDDSDDGSVGPSEQVNEKISECEQTLLRVNADAKRADLYLRGWLTSLRLGRIRGLLQSSQYGDPSEQVRQSLEKAQQEYSGIHFKAVSLLNHIGNLTPWVRRSWTQLQTLKSLESDQQEETCNALQKSFSKIDEHFYVPIAHIQEWTTHVDSLIQEEEGSRAQARTAFVDQDLERARFRPDYSERIGGQGWSQTDAQYGNSLETRGAYEELYKPGQGGV